MKISKTLGVCGVPHTRFLGVAALALFALLGAATTANADDSSDVVAAVKAYERALNNGDTEAIVDIYTADGVFMLAGQEPSIGTDALRATYQGVFNAISPRISMEVGGVHVSGDTAYAYSVSSGQVKFVATGEEVPGRGQELFVWRKSDDGTWKIAVYSASSRAPAEKAAK